MLTSVGLTTCHILTYKSFRSVWKMARLYEALPERHTRVVHLTRDTPTTISMRLLPCQLVERDADGHEARKCLLADGQQIDYVALSYTWGNALEKRELTVLDVNGQQHTIEVTASLIEAIMKLLGMVDSTDWYFWVDQMSINQASPEEKSSQISMMKEIYEYASQVVAWIGPPSSNTHLVYHHIKAIAALKQQLDQPGQPFDRETIFQRLNGELRSTIWNETERSRLQWEAIRDLLARPWFSRIWIRQEVTAKDLKDAYIACGVHVITLDIILDFLSVMYLASYGPPPHGIDFEPYMLSNLAQLDEFGMMRRSLSRRDTSLITYVRTMRSSQATDPRDKIFCLVPFASESSQDRSGFAIDYRLSPRDVYVTFAIWTFKIYRNLGIFSDALKYESNETIEDIPSWVPDWTLLGKTSFHSLAKQSSLLAASGTYTNLLEVGPYEPKEMPRLLLMDGVRLAKVSRVSEPASVEEAIEIVKRWLTTEDRHKVCSLTGETMQEVFIRTMNLELDDEESKERADLWADTLPSNLRTATIRLLAGGRCLFFTDSCDDGSPGLMGVGPFTMDPGDSIYMLKGGDVLYVLREFRLGPKDNMPCLDLTGGSRTSVSWGDDQWGAILIGECYIHGLMKGETLDFMGVEPKKETPPPLREMDTKFYEVFLM